jgi:hypothetical protein
MSFRGRFFAHVVAAVLPLAVWVGCSSKSTSSNTGVCWPASIDGNGIPVFDCLPSVQGTGLLAPCEDSIGTATCSDGMTCDATTHDGQGACTFYCDSQTPCPLLYTCSPVQVGDGATAPTIQLCRKTPDQPNQPQEPDDGGTSIVDANNPDAVHGPVQT